jgi:S1-C subfamily serine protease
MHKKKYIVAVLTLAMWLFGVDTMSIADDLNIPVAAPIDSDADSAGRGGDVASQSVVRLICVAQNTAGTGFLHKSGNIITADHVVRGCSAPEMILPTGLRATVTVIAADQEHDLALVKPSIAITAKPLAIASKGDFKVGTQVSTWGFPGGYFGLSPMLSVGYLAGIDAFKTASGKIIRQWVVNAAFNGGNSGGPLVHIKSGTIFGVVSSKLAPISSDAAYTLQILENQKFGMRYTVKKPDGTEVSFSEAQLVGKVFNELRSQVQLVIGKAVLLADLVTFLRANKIEP